MQKSQRNRKWLSLLLNIGIVVMRKKGQTIFKIQLCHLLHALDSYTYPAISNQMSCSGPYDNYTLFHCTEHVELSCNQCLVEILHSTRKAHGLNDWLVSMHQHVQQPHLKSEPNKHSQAILVFHQPHSIPEGHR